MPNGLFTLTQQARAIGQGSWVNGKTPFVNYLVVAGGGGAGASGPGGGGAGGLLQGVTNVAPNSAITVTVGAGGNGTSGSSMPGSGSNSVFGSVVANGGGAGANVSTVGASGGSGGGSGPSTTASASPGQGLSGQGNRGGFSLSSSTSGGGGGAGTVGLDGGPAGTNGGNGGAGIASDISGTRTTYAGGGGGYGTNIGSGVTGGFGGAGGGGASSNQFPAGGGNGQPGTANTGGGGGAAPNYTGGPGGSGIVIISYPDTYLAPTATTGSPTVSTSGSGSVAFSGSGQYLSTPSNSGLSFGTGDFTVEAWIYTNTLAGERGFFQTSITAGGLQSSYVDGVALCLGSSGNLTCQIGGTGVSSGATVLATGTWYHVAVTRASGAVRVFINGTLSGGPTTVTTNLPGTFASIGGYFNTSFLWNGNVSNLRVVKGTAVYTSSFTPSTAPLTAISGTSLLMNTVSGSQFVDSSTNSLTLTATGTPTWNQLSPFATGLGFKNRVYTWTSSGSITF